LTEINLSAWDTRAALPGLLDTVLVELVALVFCLHASVYSSVSVEPLVQGHVTWFSRGDGDVTFRLEAVKQSVQISIEMVEFCLSVAGVVGLVAGAHNCWIAA